MKFNERQKIMHITGGILSRPEGNARGDLHMAFSNQTLRLDAESTLDARDTARMIGPAAAKFMEPFRLNGPVRLRIAGLLDRALTIRANDLSDLEVRLRAIRVLVLGMGEPGLLLNLADAALADVEGLKAKG